MTKRPTSPGAFGDGERATEARTVVARNAPIVGASIGGRLVSVPVGWGVRVGIETVHEH